MKISWIGLAWMVAASLLAVGEAQAKPVLKSEPLRLVAQTGHGESVTSVAFSPDGKVAVSAGEDSLIKLWEVSTGRELRTLTGHKGEVKGVAFSPDGKTIVSGGHDETLILWDVATGENIRTLTKAGSYVAAVAFSPDGRTVVSGNWNHTLKIWDVKTGKELRVLTGHSKNVKTDSGYFKGMTSVAFSQDGKTLVSGSKDGTTRLWDAITGEELKTLTGHAERVVNPLAKKKLMALGRIRKGGTVKAVAFSPSGKLVASGGDDNTVRLWDVTTGKELRTMTGHKGHVSSVAFSPDGKTLVSGSNERSLNIKLWETSTGKELRTFAGHSGDVTSVAFSPKGKTLLSGSEDKTLKLWDLATGQELRVFTGRGDDVNSFAFSSDGKNLAFGSKSWLSGHDNVLKVLGITAGRKLQVIAGNQKTVNVIAFSSDGKTMLSGGDDKLLKLWDIATGKELRAFSGHKRDVTNASFSPDGKMVVSASEDHTLKLWDVSTGKALRTFAGHESGVKSVAFSPDGKKLVSGSDDNTVKLWDLTTGKELHTFTGHYTVTCVAFSPDGKAVASASNDKTLKLWDISTGKELRTFAGHESYVKSVAFSPDGKSLVSASADKTIKLWDVATGRELRTLVGHEREVHTVIFSADGKMALSGSEDMTIRFWRVQDGALLATLHPFTDGTWAVFDPQGRFDASNNGDITHLHWVFKNTSIDLSQMKERYYEPGLLQKLMGGANESLRRVATFEDKKIYRWPEVALNVDPEKPLRIKIHLTDQGDGYGRVVVRVNGKEVVANAAKGKKLSGKMALLTVEVEAARLVPGDNRVEVVAWPRFGHIPSPLAQIIVAGDTAQKFSSTGNVRSASVERPQLLVQMGHLGGSSVAFSRDGRTIVSGGRDDKSLKLWNVATGRILRTLTGHSDKVTSVAFSPDDKTVLSGSGDGTVKVWDAATGRVIHTLTGHSGEVTSVAISPDGKTVLTGSRDNTLRLWDLASARLLLTFSGHTKEVSSVAFSPDGKTVISGSEDNTIKLWDVATSRELHTFVGHKRQGLSGDKLSIFDFSSVTSVAFSPDGKTVVSGSRDNTLKLWDVVTARELRTFSGHKGWVLSVAFSRNGKTVISGSLDKTLKVWDVATGSELKTLSGHQSEVISLAASPDGKSVVSTGGDNTLKFWDLATAQEIRSVSGQGDWVTSVAISPNGETLAAGSKDKKIWLWDVASGQVPRALVGHADVVLSVNFSPDGKTLLSGSRDQTLKFWKVATGEELSTLNDRRTLVSGDGVQKLLLRAAYTPDGKTMVVWSQENLLRLLDVENGKILKILRGHRKTVNNAAFAPDGKTLVSASEDKTVKLWDVAAGTILRTFRGHGSGVDDVAFAPDGKTFVSASNDKSLKLWEVATGTELRSFTGHLNAINSVAFSPDGKLLLSGSTDKTLKLWDVSTGKELHTLAGHAEPIFGAAFAPDGKTVISASMDTTVKVWRVSDGKLLATLISFSDGRWAVTDPEGRFDVADLEDMPHLHWVMPDDPMTPLPIETFMRDYYEPRLLSRILNGDTFKNVRSMMDLNRVQPDVRITRIEDEPNQAGYVKVTVEARGARHIYAGRGVATTTGAHDLRLFRNGQLIGYAEGKLADANGKPFRRSFRVRLPGGKAPLQFSAYAFNNDRVKSATAQQTYTPKNVITASKPRAYLITIGVNRHDNPDWDLRYAANDARQIDKSLAARLSAHANYEAVVTIPLTSDTEGQNLATKANLKAVLDILAGRKANISAIPGAGQLRQATPDDLVLISFSGHGFGEGGLFYLIPGDTGTGSGREITSKLTAHAISSDELSAWLKDVDAGHMAMIVDACHSAASVGEAFKPGPMGSRGLGQLAFDKGMRILAASQADDVALESDLIKQGLLSFALVQNGLEGHLADYKPMDKKITLEEWLNYGVNRVPALADEVKSGKLVAVRGTSDERGAVRLSGGKSMKKRAIQQPALFDFTKGRRDVLVEAGLQ